MTGEGKKKAGELVLPVAKRGENRFFYLSLRRRNVARHGGFVEPIAFCKRGNICAAQIVMHKHLALAYGEALVECAHGFGAQYPVIARVCGGVLFAVRRKREPLCKGPLKVDIEFSFHTLVSFLVL